MVMYINFFFYLDLLEVHVGLQDFFDFFDDRFPKKVHQNIMQKNSCYQINFSNIFDNIQHVI